MCRPNTVRAIDEGRSHVRARRDAARSEHQERLHLADDVAQQRQRPDDALVVTAGLRSLRNDRIDAGMSRVHRLRRGCGLHPDATAAVVQTIDPTLGRHIEVKDHERHALGDADIDVLIGGRRPERRGVVEKVDAEGLARAGRYHLYELSGAGRRLDRITENADTSNVGDRRHQRRVRDEPHSRADKRKPHTVLPRQSSTEWIAGGDVTNGYLLTRRPRIPMG